MEEINWEPNLEPIKEQELTEKEKELAKLCSEEELEYKEIINAINLFKNNDF